MENLQFLTAEQMLHDVAALIAVIRRRHAASYSPIILWGSGYGATIAAWTRKKYPHLVDGVWSSSGIFQIDSGSLRKYELLMRKICKTNYFTCADKYDGIGAAFLHANEYEDCRRNVQEALFAIEELLERENGDAVQELFNLCHPIDTSNEKDMSFFYEALMEFIVEYIESFQ